MKKYLLVLVMFGLVLSLASCKRSDLDDPSWDGPSGYNIIVDGSASPAVLIINGAPNLCVIRVKVTNSAGAPIANHLLFFQQLNDQYQEVAWGVFENGGANISKVTNASGEAVVAFYSPLVLYSHNMYIRALLQVNGHAFNYNSSTGTFPAGIPMDYIAIAMVNGFN
jgi:hypothetical protein